MLLLGAVILWLVLGGAIFLAIALIALETADAERQGQWYPQAGLERPKEPVRAAGLVSLSATEPGRRTDGR